MRDKILFVGGTWDNKCGKPSKIVNKFAQYFEITDLYNGGNYNNLEKIINTVTNYNIIIWWPNVNNDLPKIRNIKEINPKAMLISSKRNIDNKYSFQDLVERALMSKSNLIVEFSDKNNKYFIRLFDPLGNVWYEGLEIKECSSVIKNRLDFIKNITRQSSTSSEENSGALAWFFNMFKQEMYKSDYILNIPEKKEFLNLIRKYAYIFASATFETKDVKRFLGNASFRCPKGFPSFRDGKYIFVSKRNVNTEFITIDDFVPVYYEDNKLYYCGNAKPSVDSPIQVRLYYKLPNINYMIHSHCYIENAPYTEMSVPCGTIEEVDEIVNVIRNYYNNDFNKNAYFINLKGHGSIMMSNNTQQLENINIIGRKLPEKMY